MPTSLVQNENFLNNLPFLREMNEVSIADFFSQSQVKEYPKNHAIFIHGDLADRFFIVLDGCVKLHRETPEGSESIISVLVKGDVFGEIAVFGNAQYPCSAHVAENAKLVEISSSLLREKAKSNPSLMAYIMHVISNEMSHLRLEKEHMALMSTSQRVGCLLLQLSADMQGKGGTFTFPYDKSLAAAYLGMKPETFSRSLTQLKPLGVTVKGSEIKIDDFNSLVEYTCGHCSALPGECRKADCCTYECAKKKLCSEQKAMKG